MEYIPDLRAEILALELALAGELDFSSAVYAPQGLLRRAVTQDVDSLETVCLPGESTPSWHFTLNREGFYEALPEAFLHLRRERQDDDTPADILLHFRALEEEKAEARRFFLPFEQNFFQLRVELEQWESANYMGWLGGGHGTALAEFWELPQWFTERQALLACYVLPYLHRVTGHLPMTSAVFEAMLGCRVEITRIDPVPTSCDLHLKPLGAGYLGSDLILSAQLGEGLPAWRLRLTDWPVRRLTEYFRGGDDARMIEWLGAYLFPAGFDVSIEIEVRAEERQFFLGFGDEHCLLGYTASF